MKTVWEEYFLKQKLLSVWRNFRFAILFNLIFSILWRLIITLVDHTTPEYAVPAFVAYVLLQGGLALLFLFYGIYFQMKHQTTNKELFLSALVIFIIAVITCYPLFPASLGAEEAWWLLIVSLEEAFGFLFGSGVGKVFRYFGGGPRSQSPLQK